MPNIENELDTRLALDEPKQYKVLLHNDDYTSMEFVIEVLMHLFHRTLADAERIMLDIHKKEKGVCGIYTHQIAETKVHQVKELAKANGFPLLATMEAV